MVSGCWIEVGIVVKGVACAIVVTGMVVVEIVVRGCLLMIGA